MNRRVHTSDDFGGIQGWWSTIPPVTKLLGSLWGGSAILALIGLLPVRLIHLEAGLVFQRAQV